MLKCVDCGCYTDATVKNEKFGYVIPLCKSCFYKSIPRAKVIKVNLNKFTLREASYLLDGHFGCLNLKSVFSECYLVYKNRYDAMGLRAHAYDSVGIVFRLLNGRCIFSRIDEGFWALDFKPFNMKSAVILHEKDFDYSGYYLDLED